MAYNLPSSLTTIQLSNIDGTVAATSTLGTTNAGAKFVPLYANVQLQSTTGFAVVASLSIGTNGGVNDILPITALTGVSTANLMINLPLVAVISSVAASTAISVKITTGATATTYVLRVALIGFYS